MHGELLTIGRFARLCRLSVKRLRHYDELGLLAPVHVDAGSGYRYYAAGQVGPARAPDEEPVTRLIIPIQEGTT
ncbi:hypothetical protein Sru01_64030 [Sphaerisporangium rufum]|uniref:HTH merR-type domain-containing protein n=1 Tax=Sphaerisporangium rufum TaxID=1381558 RepID=A0A919RAJ0_9ACTN|nr:MerR family DNA-binding transcriptional regulator [Sphaerisporangium rufum]GII81421.1 hypothetical protein Sru01_64030 [Sphaerisporangium rufum]